MRGFWFDGWELLIIFIVCSRDLILGFLFFDSEMGVCFVVREVRFILCLVFATTWKDVVN